MFFSPEHRCVVYPIPPERPWLGAQICATIPGARQLNASYFTVPAELHALRLARLSNLPVPAIMDAEGYTWPAAPGIRPFPHQRHMSNFKVLHPRSFDLSQMRTGKTLGSLWAADFLMTKGEVHRALIISPLSTLERVWYRAITQNFLGCRTAAVLHGSMEKRFSRLSEPHDFYIINHDGFRSGARRGIRNRPFDPGPFCRAIIEREDIDLIIVDEASAYRDARSLRSICLQKMIGQKGMPGAKPYVWLMTGTPTPRAPTDAYGLAMLLGTVTRGFKRFQDETMQRLTEFKYIPRRDAQEKVSKVLQPAIRYSRAECIDLPPPEFETLDVELSAEQQKAYDTLRKELALELKAGKQITAVNEAVLRGKLIQISAGAVYGANREVHRLDCKPRVDALKEVIDEAGGKIVIFAGLVSVVDFLHSELKLEYGHDSVAKIYGDVTPKERAEIFRRFDEEESLKILVAHPAVMSHGLDLSVADTLVWFAPIDDLEIYDQANARIDGPRQKRDMLIVRLAATKVEKEIYRRLEEKASLQGAILKLAEEGR